VDGIVLDSSVAIRAERSKIGVIELLEQVWSVTQVEQVGLTAIGVTELVHGIYRAPTAERAAVRRSFLGWLLRELPVFDYTVPVAELAGRIDAEQRLVGNVIPFTDLLIGATALTHQCGLLTVNVRHFKMIPGLRVLFF
jgi:predicted nucleic acid-binding protein